MRARARTHTQPRGAHVATSVDGDMENGRSGIEARLIVLDNSGAGAYATIPGRCWPGLADWLAGSRECSLPLSLSLSLSLSLFLSLSLSLSHTFSFSFSISSLATPQTSSTFAPSFLSFVAQPFPLGISAFCPFRDFDSSLYYAFLHFVHFVHLSVHFWKGRDAFFRIFPYCSYPFCFFGRTGMIPRLPLAQVLCLTSSGSVHIESRAPPF